MYEMKERRKDEQCYRKEWKLVILQYFVCRWRGGLNLFVRSSEDLSVNGLLMWSRPYQNTQCFWPMWVLGNAWRNAKAFLHWLTAYPEKVTTAIFLKFNGLKTVPLQNQLLAIVSNLACFLRCTQKLCLFLSLSVCNNHVELLLC